MTTRNKAEAIIKDARTLVKYATTRLGFEPSNIILSGRSMGSGPASLLASEGKFQGLVIISPFTSIRKITKEKYGRLTEFLVSDSFDNL